MDTSRQLRFWIVGALLLFASLWLLSGMLLPFVAGLAIAYFLDPLVDRLERAGLSRTLATALVSAVALAVAVAVLLLVVPLVAEQAAKLAAKAPQYAATAYRRVLPLLEPLKGHFGIGDEPLKELEAAAAQRAGQIVTFAAGLVGGVISRGFALVNLLALIFLTPVVAFYLLRDWNTIIAKVDGWLPVKHAPVIRRLALESDAAIAGYVRGQATVCLCLAVFYGLGLMAVGLEFGLIIGIIAGAISFIPFVGTWTGGIMAMGMALAQFASRAPPEWLPVAMVAGVFVVGQILEGYVLSPKLVGDSVGLHPVWIMFALLAGGALLGFVGVLIAVPVAAIVGVLVRFLLRQYLGSIYYGRDESTTLADG